jgi:hypothetical protein
MMSPPRAQRLARRAARRRPDGSPGPLARRALRVLARRGRRGDQNLADAGWQAWLAHPDDELWQALAADPLRGEIAVLNPGRWIEYFREPTLARVEGVLFTRATQFWASSDGRYHVLVAPSADAPAHDVTVIVQNQVLYPVASVRARPMAALGPPDLAAAITARDAFAATPPSPFLDLFAACLQHRFGADVGIGRSTPEIGDDEIGISPAIGGRG